MYIETLCPLRHLLICNTIIKKTYYNKVDIPNSKIAINWTPISELYVVRCNSKSGHQRGMCSKEIGLCIQYTLIVLCLIANKIGEIFMATC